MDSCAIAVSMCALTVSQVSDKLLEVVGAVGVKIYWEHLVADVALSRTGFLQYVDIRSKSGAYTAEFAAEQEGGESKGQYTETGDLRIPCIALLCCNQKQCDKDVFCAINDSGLVFDGGLVVDAVSRNMCSLCILSLTFFSTIGSHSAQWTPAFTAWGTSRASRACIKTHCHMPGDHLFCSSLSLC